MENKNIEQLRERNNLITCIAASLDTHTEKIVLLARLTFIEERYDPLLNRTKRSTYDEFFITRERAQEELDRQRIVSQGLYEQRAIKTNRINVKITMCLCKIYSVTEIEGGGARCGR